MNDQSNTVMGISEKQIDIYFSGSDTVVVSRPAFSSSRSANTGPGWAMMSVYAATSIILDASIHQHPSISVTAKSG